MKRDSEEIDEGKRNTLRTFGGLLAGSAITPLSGSSDAEYSGAKEEAVENDFEAEKYTVIGRSDGYFVLKVGPLDEAPGYVSNESMGFWDEDNFWREKLEGLKDGESVNVEPPEGVDLQEEWNRNRIMGYGQEEAEKASGMVSRTADGTTETTVQGVPGSLEDDLYGNQHFHGQSYEAHVMNGKTVFHFFNKDKDYLIGKDSRDQEFFAEVVEDALEN